MNPKLETIMHFATISVGVLMGMDVFNGPSANPIVKAVLGLLIALVGAYNNSEHQKTQAAIVRAAGSIVVPVPEVK